jgi:organic radical activating enzyme
MFTNKENNQNVFSSEETSGVASKYKIASHEERIADYIKGKNIFPITLELDLTNECNRLCNECPSTRAKKFDNLIPEFVEKLFTLLEGQTPGLLLSGGEPTIAPLFPKALSMARKKGFKEIAVVTNGSKLDDPKINSALLEHVSTVRLSMYDFTNSSCEGIKKSLHRIENLRKRIDSTGSNLQIGISILTSKDRLEILSKITDAVCSSGAHWLYFHPTCTNWEKGAPKIIDQEGVVEEIENLQENYKNKFDIFYAPHRYTHSEIEFDGYHGAFYLMIVGADAKNYLGAEVKYQPPHIIADFSEDLKEGFLWKEERLNNILSVKSDTYPAIGSRHRGALYSDLIEKIKINEPNTMSIMDQDIDFRFPGIL